LLVEDAISKRICTITDLGRYGKDGAVLDVGVLNLESASKDSLQLTGEEKPTWSFRISVVIRGGSQIKCRQ